MSERYERTDERVAQSSLRLFLNHLAHCAGDAAIHQDVGELSQGHRIFVAVGAVFQPSLQGTQVVLDQVFCEGDEGKDRKKWNNT